MSTPTTNNPSKSDVLQSHEHLQLTPEQIAKAQARHQREHPGKGQPPAKKAQRG